MLLYLAFIYSFKVTDKAPYENRIDPLNIAPAKNGELSFTTGNNEQFYQLNQMLRH